MIQGKDEFKLKYQEKFMKMHGKKIEEGTDLDKYLALAGLVREELTGDWIECNQKYSQPGKKQVYYFSMEFLLGRLLNSNLTNLGIRDITAEGLQELGINLSLLEEQEPDAGLGNGGLGRLGACFLDSMASLPIAGHGCSIRYRYGMFKQKIVDGFQVELPDDWLRNGNTWEIRKPDKAVEVRFGGKVRIDSSYGKMVFFHENYEPVRAVPYDMPVAGYKNKTVNTLRLWSAEEINKSFDYSTFNRGEYLKAVDYKYSVEAISQILYPDDSLEKGKLLRLKQQYFFVSAGLQSIVKRYRKKHHDMQNFADMVAIHINDTHPALCIPELMRILLDEDGMGWDEAWEITTKAISYTNHTILPEALEIWPQESFKGLLPRIHMIVEEINRRLLEQLWKRYPDDLNKIKDMAIISSGSIKMANLAVVGSHHVNGVSKIHSEILQSHLMKNFYELYPGKFSNKTNGISHRRFFLGANPGLARLVTNTIGPAWIKEPDFLHNLLHCADDPAFIEKIARVKRANKEALASYIKEHNGIILDIDSIFDVQVKRIHAYKRQLLNVLHIMYLYNNLKENPGVDMLPRTFIFAGKASPGYYMAKRIIKLINTLGDKINNDPDVNNRIKVLYLENYNVSLAEMIIPAADLSEQISTASKEASGTGNMKFMMNGAITIGTLDGANVEIRDEVGGENIIIFGLTAKEVLNYYQNGGYSSWEEYHNNPRVAKVLEQLINGFLPGVKEEYKAIYDSLLHHNDEFFLLKDFDAYTAAQEKADFLYRDKKKWNNMCIINIAKSGRFYSDRTISEYAKDIWKVLLIE